jgi:hypothetical protein
MDAMELVTSLGRTLMGLWGGLLLLMIVSLWIPDSTGDARDARRNADHGHFIGTPQP